MESNAIEVGYGLVDVGWRCSAYTGRVRLVGTELVRLNLPGEPLC